MPAPKKAQAARAEAAGGTITVESHGLTLTIPAKMPFSLFRFMGAEDPGPREVIGILETLLGPEQMNTVWSAGLDMDQGSALIDDLMAASGLSTGESPASQDSSTNAGT